MENSIEEIKRKKIEKSGKINKESSKVKKNIFLIFTGVLIGFVNGFFGGGGGMICVPILEKVLKLPTKKAHATTIAVIFPLSFLSAAIYIFNGVVESLPLVTVMTGVILGGVIGSMLLKILPSKVVGIIFSILMIVAGVRLII